MFALLSVDQSARDRCRMQTGPEGRAAGEPGAGDVPYNAAVPGDRDLHRVFCPAADSGASKIDMYTFGF